ncbi:TetR/AcrR family transcriptional regulator [Oceanobacillus sp. CAU 1775]
MPKISDEAKEERKIKILDAALECFSKKGYSASTVDDIVKYSELSKGSVYNYFKSKEEIFLSLLNQRSEAVFENLRVNLARIDSPVEKLKYWIRTDLPYDINKRKFMHVHIESWLYASDAPHVKEVLKKNFDILFGMTEEIISQGQEIGEIKKDIDTNAAAAMFWSLHDGIWLHASIGYDEEKIEARIVEMEKAMLAYLT